MTETDETYDALVVGGGLVGLAAALSLNAAKLRVAVIDAAPVQTQLAPEFDGRASALAFTSWRMFEALGVAQHLAPNAEPLTEILVSDGRAPDGLRKGGPGPFLLHFDSAELKDSGAGPRRFLGMMAENRHIRHALGQAMAAHGIPHIGSAQAVAFDFSGPAASVTLKDGRVLRARLIVAADGRFSPTRAAADIRTTDWRYRQTAVVATALHDAPHHGVAHEYFLPSGPFAILPLPDDGGTHRSSLVWTERPNAAKALMQLPEADFAEELTRRFGRFWGDVRPAGPRWSYPLGLQIADRYVGPRLVLVGDAGHAIHPIAGQGFNLGLRDAAALADVLSEARATGLDIGAETALAPYERWRKADNVSLALGTDLFNRLFSTDFGPVRLVRGAGMALTGAVGPARRFFAMHAGGATGEPPALLRGDAPGA